MIRTFEESTEHLDIRHNNVSNTGRTLGWGRKEKEEGDEKKKEKKMMMRRLRRIRMRKKD